MIQANHQMLATRTYGQMVIYPGNAGFCNLAIGALVVVHGHNHTPPTTIRSFPEIAIPVVPIKLLDILHKSCWSDGIPGDARLLRPAPKAEPGLFPDAAKA